LTLKDLYRLSQAGYRGKATVPVLWDAWENKIINNESSEIIKILNGQFNDFAFYKNIDLYPESLQSEIEAWNKKIYYSVNDGVYRCGFARTQLAYETACLEIFNTLDEIDIVLNEKSYLCGDALTLADVQLFTTLFRFDAVYYGLFNCSIKRIADYPNISRYVQKIYNLDGVATTCNLEKVKIDYYSQLFPLNPSGIIPLG
jgi:putative glutathione S-transferase